MRPTATAGPIDTVPRIPRRALLLLAVIAFGWGMNWPAMKVAVGEIPVWTFRAACILIAAPLLLGTTWLQGKPVALPLRQVPTILKISLFSVAAWQVLSALGLVFIGSGKAAIIAFTMPLWATFLSAIFLGEQLTARHAMALAAGMAALALLLGEELLIVGESPLGGLIMVMAAMSWAIGTVLVKKLDWRGIPTTAFTGWQLALGGVPVVLGAILFDPLPDLADWSPAAWGGLLFASVVGLVICVTAYFQVVTLVPASIAAIGTLAVPVVGVLGSALLLGEAIGWPEITALCLVVLGLGLLFRPWRRRS